MKPVELVNFRIDLDRWRSYYHDLCETHSHRRWTWQRNGADLDPVDALGPCGEQPEYRLQSGFLLQSNTVDPGVEPSLMRTRHPVLPPGVYRDLDLLEDPVQSLRQALGDVAYRWTVFEMQPGGRVVSHTDPGEIALVIPLYWPPAQTFRVGDADYEFPADGSVWAVDAEIPHSTYNGGLELRVNVIARVFKVREDVLFGLRGVF